MKRKSGSKGNKGSFLTKLAVRLCSFVMWEEFHYPQPIKGRYNVAGNKLEKVKWAYRCWLHQLEKAEKGSGIEEYFAGQDIRFTLPEELEVKNQFSVSAGGDLLAVECLTYENTRHLFDGIEEFYFHTDLTCANLESVVCPSAPPGRNQVLGKAGKMNTSVKMLDRFIAGGKGINYFSTANNHSYDYEKEGVLSTIAELEKRDCCFSGTNRGKEEQEDVLVKEINGIRVALLSYTFDLNGNECPDKSLVNEVRFCDEVCDYALVERHIQKAREKKADLIVASVHWGWEFEMYPHKNVIEAGHRLADMGVDVILGSHPHVAQPMEKYKNSLIVYSLGDFVSYHPQTRNSRLTYVIRFRVTKGVRRETGEEVCCISGLKVMPVYILNAEKEDGSFDCRLLPLKKVLQNPEGYPLTKKERRDLPRLYKKVWKQILLPREHRHYVTY